LGTSFVSLPFLDYGGILADAPQYETALATAAADLAAKRGAHHIELRQSFAAREVRRRMEAAAAQAALVIRSMPIPTHTGPV